MNKKRGVQAAFEVLVNIHFFIMVDFNFYIIFIE